MGALGKTADGLSYAYMKMNIAEKEIEKLYDSISSYTNLRHLDISQNRIQNVQHLLSLKYLVSLNASKNEIASLILFSNSDDFQYLQYLNVSGNKLT